MPEEAVRSEPARTEKAQKSEQKAEKAQKNAQKEEKKATLEAKKAGTAGLAAIVVPASFVKMPVHPFFSFTNEKRPELMANGVKMTDVGKETKKLWDGLSEEQKKPYLEQYEKEKAA